MAATADSGSGNVIRTAAISSEEGGTASGGREEGAAGAAARTCGATHGETSLWSTYVVRTSGSSSAIAILISICAAVGLFVTVVNVLQHRRPTWLPPKLRSWAWLPEPMRSLRPYDERIFAPLGRVCACGPCRKAARDSFRAEAPVELRTIAVATRTAA